MCEHKRTVTVTDPAGNVLSQVEFSYTDDSGIDRLVVYLGDKAGEIQPQHPTMMSLVGEE